MTKTITIISLTDDYQPRVDVWTRTEPLPDQDGEDESGLDLGKWETAPAGGGYCSVTFKGHRTHCSIDLDMKANDTASVTDSDGDPIVKTTHLVIGSLTLSPRKLIALGRQLVAMGEGMDGPR